jgi:hypothetical protein
MLTKMNSEMLSARRMQFTDDLMEGLDRTTMQIMLPKMAKEQREVDPIPSIQKGYPTPLQADADLSPLSLEFELFGKRDPGAVKLSMSMSYFM